jgi:heparosan-N-sulfate-glucuronate 5-epimerase
MSSNGANRPTTAKRVLREIAGGYAAVVGRSVDFLPQPLGRHIDPQGLGGYYCDLRHKATDTADAMPRDGHGEPDWWVIPIAQAALGYWDLRLDGREDADEPFLVLADWLMARAEPGAGGTVWRVDKPLVKYGLAPGWASGMAQGQAASVLLRAHALTGRDDYLETARAALPPLLLPVSAGGLQSELDGVTVLEEYPTERPAAILNGWIFALFGVHELATVAGMPEARELFDRSAAGLVTLLPRYDNGWWSLYSLYDHGSPDLAKPFYQRLHPVMLDALALIHPAPELSEYAERWRTQLTKPAIARASLDKIVFRLRRARADRRKPLPGTARA